MKEKCALIHSKFGVVFSFMTMCCRSVDRGYTSLRVCPVIKVGLLTFQVQSKVCAKIYKIQTKGNQAYYEQYLLIQSMPTLHPGEGFDLQRVILKRFKMT